MADELWFVDPSAGGNKTKIPLAPRPIDLVGKVVGLIDNTKEQADVILETIAHELRTRYGVKAATSGEPGCPVVAEELGGGPDDRIWVTRAELIGLVDEALRSRGLA